jgi:hypothetical protein
MESSPSFVDVFALPTGKIHLPDRWIFEDGDNDMHRFRQLSPDFSFLICHPSGMRVLFDLGLRKVYFIIFLLLNMPDRDAGSRKQP